MNNPQSLTFSQRVLIFIKNLFGVTNSWDFRFDWIVSSGGHTVGGVYISYDSLDVELTLRQLTTKYTDLATNFYVADRFGIAIDGFRFFINFAVLIPVGTNENYSIDFCHSAPVVLFWFLIVIDLVIIVLIQLPMRYYRIQQISKWRTMGNEVSTRHWFAALLDKKLFRYQKHMNSRMLFHALASLVCFAIVESNREYYLSLGCRHDEMFFRFPAVAALYCVFMICAIVNSIGRSCTYNRKIFRSPSSFTSVNCVLPETVLVAIDEGELVKNEDSSCPICTLEMTPDNAIQLKGCQHLFHRDCIKKWAEYTGNKERGTQHKILCPLCRESVCTVFLN